MRTATISAAPDVKQGRARALCIAGGAAAAAIAWAIEVPLLGVRLSVRFGAMHPQIVAAWQVIGAALAAGLIGWLLLAVLDRRTPRARTVWTVTALLVLALSLRSPIAVAVVIGASTAVAAASRGRRALVR